MPSLLWSFSMVLNHLGLKVKIETGYAKTGRLPIGSKRYIPVLATEEEDSGRSGGFDLVYNGTDTAKVKTARVERAKRNVKW